ncbi:protein yippee-like 2 isoform X3 [Bubalus bubalis]|uniref:protein yippee-like 2 isoform X3 n=1 Tax=Bubalus bubalis TaxID=89462 RepID=UPI001D10DACC|nr:protein yippee-like 2 isoform X3 [Bubalus bubalis]
MVKMTRSKTFQAYLPSCHRTYSCIHCRAHLANHDELISKAPHLRYHPPSRERQAAPGRTRLGRAPQDTAVQPGYSCLCLFARCLLFSVNVFLIINVGLAAAQCGSHGGRACRISLVLRDSAGPWCGPGETGSSMLSLGGASGGIAA